VKLFTSNHYLLVLDNDRIVGPTIEISIDMEVHQCCTIESFEKHISSGGRPLAFLLDTHLSDFDLGMPTIDIMRTLFFDLPIIVITSDRNEMNLSQALHLGADDVLYKPFRPSELRVRILARRIQRQKLSESREISYSDVTLNLVTKNLRGPLGSVVLTPVESRIFSQLFFAEENILTMNELLAHSWLDTKVSRSSFYRKIYECRKNLSLVSSSVQIETKYGKGVRIHEARNRQSVIWG